MQCLTCQFIVMHGQPKGKGLCWKEADGTRKPKPKDVLVERNCGAWKLGAMHQVHARSTRRMVFDEQGRVKLG
jgi:hypothetical protein